MLNMFYRDSIRGVACQDDKGEIVIALEVADAHRAYAYEPAEEDHEDADTVEDPALRKVCVVVILLSGQHGERRRVDVRREEAQRQGRRKTKGLGHGAAL